MYVVSYLCILSYNSLDLCLVLCMLPPLISYSLALSSTMMSCTVHSPADSLAQLSCIVVYILCNPAPRGSPFKLSLGLRLKLPSPICPLLSEFMCVGSWSFGLGSPQWWWNHCCHLIVTIVVVSTHCATVWGHCCIGMIRVMVVSTDACGECLHCQSSLSS